MFSFLCFFLLVIFLVSLPICWAYYYYFFDKLVFFGKFIINREQIETFVLSSGWSSPFAFMLLQIFQVVFAPMPGEITGFIGGYIFGATLGFLYSSFSLTIGSWIIFYAGRFFGEKYIRSRISVTKFSKFEFLVNKRGFITIFFCFLLPGFPKDYLCLFLGVANMSLRKFLFLTGVGRMPGTLFLSFQGSAVFQGNYHLFLVCLVITLLFACVSFKYKDRLENIFDKFK